MNDHMQRIEGNAGIVELSKDVYSKEAINAASRGEYFLMPSITAKVVAEFSRFPKSTSYSSNDSHLEQLSKREVEILKLVSTGASNKEIAELLKTSSSITAIFCCNDQMAFGVIQRLKERGVNCPGDISVIGYDDDFLASYFQPSLTTIRVPVYEIAMKTVEILVDFLENSSSKKPLAGQALLPVRLIERNSVKKLISG